MLTKAELLFSSVTKNRKYYSWGEGVPEGLVHGGTGF